MKNVYKWRIITNKYLYITDENGDAPFIYDKRTGTRTYPSGRTEDTNVDEGAIASIIANVKDGNTYRDLFDAMVALAMTDEDASKLSFLPFDKYFNIDDAACVEEAVTPKCEGYTPVFNISAYTIEDTAVTYTFYGERNEQDKTLRYNLDLGIPRGLQGEPGVDGVGIQGEQGEPGEPAIVNVLGADAESADYTSVDVETSVTEDNEYGILFHFKIEKGEKGEDGVGIPGRDGAPGVITNVDCTTTTLEPGSNAEVVLVESGLTTTWNEIEGRWETSFPLEFRIPEGVQGEQGPDGQPAVITDAYVDSVETLPYGEGAWARCTLIDTLYNNEYQLKFDFGIPEGEPAPSGTTGYTGGWMYNFNDVEFIPVEGLEEPMGDFDVAYFPRLGEAEVTLQIYYPDNWGSKCDDECIKHRYEHYDDGSDSLSEGVNPDVEYNGEVLPFAKASGIRSHAEGVGFGDSGETSNASGVASHSEGRETKASGDYSHAEGYGTIASNETSHAEGYGTTASGERSHSEGTGTKATGAASHAEGSDTMASNVYAHAEGSNTHASGESSHAEGVLTKASNTCAHAEGNATTASGESSHAEGYNTTASTSYAHAEGSGTTASGQSSHAEGSGTTASGKYSHTEGAGTSASSDTAHAEGSGTTAGGKYSHAEGRSTYASGESSHAEGYLTTALTTYAHAEGSGTTANGKASHAEGYNTTATTQYAHAEGSNTHASGESSHAEGYVTTANGKYSHSEGDRTNANANNSHAEGQQTRALGNVSHAEGYDTEAVGKYSHAEGTKTNVWGDDGHAEGNRTTAYGANSHAEGRGDVDTTTETYTWSSAADTYISNYDSGTISMSSKIKPGAVVYFGDGIYRLVTSVNSGGFSINSSIGINPPSTPIQITVCCGGIATGENSHVGGKGTIANQNNMTAIGTYNKSGETGDLFVIGNGSDDSSRSNVLSVNGSTTKVTLKNSTGGIKFETGGDRNELWNTSGGTTQIFGDLIPTVKNELIYSDDGSSLTTHQLMFTGGLVVDNAEDLELCKQGADVSMAKVFSDWQQWGSSSYDDEDYWGYYASDGSRTGEAMNGTYTPTYYFKDFKVGDSDEGYIYNTKNTLAYTGYYSKEGFESYKTTIAAGNLSAGDDGKITSNAAGSTDFIGVVPLMYVNDNDSDTSYRYCGITISAINSNDSGNSRGNSNGWTGVNDGKHSISLEIWHQTTITGISGTISLLSRTEGLSIVDYKTGYDNAKTGDYASVRQLKMEKNGNVLTIWVSDAYWTYDDDSNHDVFNDRPIVIDLDNQTLSYIDSGGTQYLKDFSDSSNPPIKSGTTRYTASEVTIIQTIFNKLKGAARRGYEVFSNPGSIFRNVSVDDLLIDITSGENKVYQFDGQDWVVINTTPQELFSNGSRIAYNRVTGKLFYNNGTKIYNISSQTKVGYLIPITYDELKTLRDESGLTPGLQYRITDYVTKVGSQVSSRVMSAEIPFDIIVTADSVNTLNENVRFALPSDTSITYFNNCKIEAWEGKYTIDNDTSRFDWADLSGGTGVIYELRDEYNNKCSYDFKNILFHYNDGYYYTFNKYIPEWFIGMSLPLVIQPEEGESTYIDASLNGTSYNNTILPHITNNGMLLNAISLTDSPHDNLIEQGCYNIKLVGESGTTLSHLLIMRGTNTVDTTIPGNISYQRVIGRRTGQTGPTNITIANPMDYLISAVNS